MRIHFLYPAVAITIIWIIFKVFNIIYVKKKFDFKREIVNLLYFVSVMGIIGLTIFPLEISTGSECEFFLVLSCERNFLEKMASLSAATDAF